MKFETLRIRGVCGVIGETFIDFRTLPNGPVAIIGPNGAGKSTILDALLACLEREWPSRAGKLFDYVPDRGSFIETTVAMVGRGVFHARLNLDGISRKSEATLSQMLPDRRVPLNDGNNLTYDAAVAKVFPPFPVLKASSFAAQGGAGSFVSADRAARRDLFALIYGLGDHERRAATCRAAAKLVNDGRIFLRAVVTALDTDLDPVVDTALATEAEILTRQGHEAHHAEQQASTLVSSLEARIEALRASLAAHVAATATLAQLQQTLTERGRDAERLAAELVRVSEDQVRDLATADARQAETLAGLQAAALRLASDEPRALREAAEAHAAVIRDLEQRITNNRELEDQGDQIAAAVRETQAAAATITTARAEVARLMADMDRARAAHRALECRVVDLREVAGDLQRAEHGAKTLKVVPCADVPAYRACPFLVDATAAERRVPSLRASAAPLTDAIADQEASTLAIVGMTAALSHHQGMVLAQERIIADPVRAKLVGRHEHFKVWEATVAGYEERIDAERTAAARDQLVIAQQFAERRLAIEVDRQAAVLAHTDARSTITTRAGVRALEFRAEQNRTTTAITGLNVEIASVTRARDAHATDANAAADLASELHVRRREATDAGLDRLRIAGRLDGLAHQQAQRAAKLVQLQEARTRTQTLETEAIEWETLARAFGREGLPTLEIDAAGPTVSAIGNDILHTCSGPRFTMDLVTQVEKAGGKGTKEVFEVLVTDNDRGGQPRDIAMLSGGEQVLVDEALKAAIAVAVNQQMSTPILTLCRDEVDGKLDRVKRAHYLPMLRRLIALSGAEQLLFVTHDMDIAWQADAQIRVAQGGVVTIETPPYSSVDSLFADVEAQ